MTPHHILLLLLAGMALLTTSVAAAPYTISSGYENPPDGAIPMTPTPIGLLELPLWILLLQLAYLPIETVAALKIWGVCGYRRISGSNALGNPLRKEIFERICTEPGIHLHEIARRTGATLSTIRYHCAILERSHMIRVMEEKGFRRFFQNGGAYSRDELDLLSCLRSKTSSEILRIVMVRPEISRQEIADAIGKSGPSITWHMQRLEEKGLLSIRREGRSVRYRIDEPTSLLLARTMAKTEAAG
jgi:predicted transcriptional regulator